MAVRNSVMCAALASVTPITNGLGALNAGGLPPACRHHCPRYQQLSVAIAVLLWTRWGSVCRLRRERPALESYQPAFTRARIPINADNNSQADPAKYRMLKSLSHANPGLQFM